MSEFGTDDLTAPPDRLQETVWGHLDRLVGENRFFDLIGRDPKLAHELFSTTYEELKSEIFIEAIPTTRARLVDLFEEYFQGSHRALYQDLLGRDLDLDVLEAQAQGWAGASAAAELRVERTGRDILQGHLTRLRTLYNKDGAYPDKLVGDLDGWMASLVEELEGERASLGLSDIFETLKRDFMRIHPSYLEPLKKYEERLARIHAPEEEVIELAEAEEEITELTEAAHDPEAAAPPLQAEPIGAGAAWTLFMSHLHLSPSEYAGKIKEIIGRWKEHLKREPMRLHKLSHIMHRLSQEHLDALLKSRGGALDDEVLKARQLNASLGILFAQSAERGIRRMKGIVRSK